MIKFILLFMISTNALAGGAGQDYCKKKCLELNKKYVDENSKLKKENALMKVEIAKLQDIVRTLGAVYKSKNRVMVHGGLGPAGLSNTRVDGGVIVKPKRDPVAGLSYFRRFSHSYSFGGSFITSGNIRSSTGLVGVGLDF